MPYASVFRPDLFAGKVAIVTGGGSGIGRCIAHELASLSATVVLSGRKEEKLLTVKAEIEASGGKADHVVANMRSEAEVQALMTTTVARHGRLDYLVNNAGGQFLAPPDGISLKGWNAVIETNLTGTFVACKAAKAAWMGAHGGAIVSIVADFWNGMPLMAHTSAARAGVSNLMQSLALAWAPAGIRLNAVAPGTIRSSGLKNYPPPVVQMLAEFQREIPAKRLGSESEVSAAVTFLLSPAAAYVTGETFKVDGGSSLYRQLAPVADHHNFPVFEGLHLPADLPDGA